MNRKIHFKIFTIILILLMLFPVLSVNSYAEFEISCNSNNKGLLDSFMKENYGLEASQWSCDRNAYEYPLIIEVPIKKVCGLNFDNGGTGPVGTRTDAKEIVECTSPIELSLQNYNKIGSIEDVPNNSNYGYSSDYTHVRIAYMAGYMTISSSKQLEMGDVDINIVDGMVKVTGLIDDDTAGWNVIYQKYKTVINGFLGLCVLSCVLVFIVSSIKLGSTAGNPAERKKVMTAMLLSGIGTAGLGAVLLLFGFFFNLL